MLACYPPPTLLAGQEFATNLLLKNMGSCSCLTQHPLPLVLSLDLRLVAFPDESSADSVFVPVGSAVVLLSPQPLKLQSALMASPCPSKSSPADSFSGSLSFGIMVYAIKILLLRVLPWCLPSNNNNNKDGLFLFGLHERSLID